MENIGQIAQRVLAKPAEATPHLPSTSPVVRPRLVDLEADSKIPLRVWSSWIPAYGDRPLKRELTAAERSTVARRAQELVQGLTPFRPSEADQVRAALHAMLGGFRSLRARDDNAEGSVEVLLCVLRDFPAWAIDQACMRIARREAGLDPRWPPNDSEIHAVVSDVVAPYRCIRDRLQSLLIAPIEPPPMPKPAPQQDWHVWQWRLHQRNGDGKHALRVAAELEQRRLRNSPTDPPKEQSAA